ncbi:alkaline phosphatase family protein [Natronococcus sp. A-GB1]|uniref:alkaline phosphatase family protein n=1 Tax=Natronococcus sp. A-GB1 TaxID=3037648 RepID=UPI00241DCEBA|nr:alkaline phosphatase family protein [Natronococcus sp. A-GB1]MDG5761820.1 alkaline phosphatase family protein [Natronococcus sp. A-GB1]
MTDSVLLIGIDAGDFRTIDPLIEDGTMPTIAALLENGYHATLESSLPPWTPAAWTSLTSGKNPGKHGVFDFETPDGERLVDARDVRTRRIWDYLSEAGRRSIVVNVPVTDPAPTIDGVVVPGFLGREVDRAKAHPDGILEELREAIGEYRVYADDSLEGEALCEEYVRTMRTRRDAIEYLCDSYEWEFAMVEFQATDLVFHDLPEPRHVRHVYRELDAFVESVIDVADADVTLLASDHGMGPTGEWDVRLNAWLKRRGYLETAVDGREHGWTKPGTETDRTGGGGRTARLTRTLSRLGLTPQRIESGLAAVGADTLAKRALPEAVLERVVAGGEKIDPEASAAYFPSSSGLGIYCDAAIRRDLVDELRTLTAPDGDPVFERVEPSEQVFDGPYATDGPDIVVVPNRFDYFLSAAVSASVFDRSRYAFNHKREGILIGSGPAVETATTRESRSIYDVAPTVLGLLDVPRDAAFDGEPVPELADGTPLKAYDDRDADEIGSDGERREVRSRLEDLGYFD